MTQRNCKWIKVETFVNRKKKENKEKFVYLWSVHIGSTMNEHQKFNFCKNFYFFLVLSLCQDSIHFLIEQNENIFIVWRK